MSQNRSIREHVPLFLALLCIVAIGLSAATLTDATVPFADDPSPEPKPIVDRGQSSVDGGSGTGNPAARESYFDLQVCVQFLTSPLAVLGIVALLGGVVAIVARYFTIAAGIIIGLVLVPPVAIAYFFMTNCATMPGGGAGPALPEGIGGLGSTGITSPLPTWASMGLVALAVLGGAVAVFLSASGDDEFVPDDEDAEEEVDAADIAAAAGDAADRVEQRDAGIDNEIYRAWDEMTSLLRIDSPESSTAREFATAGIDAGLSEPDVRELTDLFEEVRYGTEQPSPAREERAVETLRRIEETYEESGPSKDGDNPQEEN